MNRDKTPLIKTFLEQSRWVDAPATVEFLAAGEYNENYRVTDGNGDETVFRINHGSQLGLTRQIEYEFSVLQAVAPSGVTPKPFYCDPDPEGIGDGVLLMGFLPGKPLDYDRDLYRAADIFSRIHRLPASPRLIVQENPIRDIAAESHGLIHRFPDHPMTDVKKQLQDYHETIRQLGEDHASFFNNEPMCTVNTEVNSHNFLITADNGFLVDWEKAVTSCRYQDLGHFLVPTTTLWKTDHTYTQAEKRDFLSRYRTYSNLDISLDEMVEKTALLEKTILLRGLSWCFMAYYEYTRADRALTSTTTFKKIRWYLSHVDWFLNPPSGDR